MQNMERLTGEDYQEVVARGQAMLDATSGDLEGAVLLYDGFITLAEGRLDALLLDARMYGESLAESKMAIPYRPAESPEGLAVHRPKVLAADVSGAAAAALIEAFFRGVGRHRQGAAIWDEHFDESR